jgi:hypothetical protein
MMMSFNAKLNIDGMIAEPRELSSMLKGMTRPLKRRQGTKGK